MVRTLVPAGKSATRSASFAKKTCFSSSETAKAGSGGSQ
jgi:hypothetical protein